MTYIVVGVPILLLVALGLFAAVSFLKQPSLQSGVNPPQSSASSTVVEHYDNAAYGIAFDYPTGYVLDAKERGDGHRGHYGIVLIREEDSAPRVDSEGPTAISIDLYQNDLDGQTLVGWLKGSSFSNFKLSDGTYASTTVGGKEAVTYHWSGLYEGETTAFLHGKSVVAVSVTFITPEDVNIDTYKKLLASLKLSE